MHPILFKKSLALVGAGNWGKNLARNFYALNALHTICDAKDSLLEQYPSIYPDVAITTDFNEVLQNEHIHAVAIAAPAALHYKLAKLALINDKDVYVEKPLCLNSYEGEELIQIAKERGKILMVGHLLQYHPCVTRLKELVGNGELGKLQYIVSNRLNLGFIRTEENALWSFAPHDISVILSLCGHRLPTQVRCVGEAYLSKGIADTTMTTLRFEGDVRAHIYVSWIHPFKEQKLVVVGSSGMAVFDDTKSWEDKLLIYRNHVTWSQGNIPQANKNEAEKISIKQEEPLREECLHFLKCCTDRLEPKTNGIEGLRVLKVLQAAQDSLDEDGETKNPAKCDLKNQQALRYFAHFTAIVDQGAEVNQGVKIWQFSHIMKGAKLGPFCNIGQNVVISPGVTLGCNVKIQNNVSVYTGVTCEDDVFLGPSMVFTNVINPRSAVNRRDEYQKTLLKKGSTVGANATIICGVVLGEYSFVGAGAVVTKDVKPFALVVGNPAKQIGWISRHGEKLDLPLKSNKGEKLTAKCAETGDLYMLCDGELSLQT